jgi:hypothetical protein
MSITSCRIDGLDFRLDYEQILGDDGIEYSGILHRKEPIAFIFNEHSFSPANTEQAHQEAIRNAIRVHEEN